MVAVVADLRLRTRLRQAAQHLNADEVTCDRILRSYELLSPFPHALIPFEVPSSAGYEVTVLSNGDPGILTTLAANTCLETFLTEIVGATRLE